MTGDVIGDLLCDGTVRSAGKAAVEQQREDQAEQELEGDRAEGPPQRVAQRLEKDVVARERAEVL